MDYKNIPKFFIEEIEKQINTEWLKLARFNQLLSNMKNKTVRVEFEEEVELSQSNISRMQSQFLQLFPKNENNTRQVAVDKEEEAIKNKLEALEDKVLSYKQLIDNQQELKEIILEIYKNTSSTSSTDKTRILVLASNPEALSELNLAEELKVINKVMAPRYDKFDINFLMNTEVEDLRNMLSSYKPHFVHFSGHGKPEGLAFMEADSEQPRYLNGTDLALLLKVFKDEINCVLLNACFSEKQAIEIVEHIPHAIGMNRVIEDESAKKFSEYFYTSIRDGRVVKQAFDFAIASMDLEKIPDESVPRYFGKGS